MTPYWLSTVQRRQECLRHTPVMSARGRLRLLDPHRPFIHFGEAVEHGGVVSGDDEFWIGGELLHAVLGAQV